MREFSGPFVERGVPLRQAVLPTLASARWRSWLTKESFRPGIMYPGYGHKGIRNMPRSRWKQVFVTPVRKPARYTCLHFNTGSGDGGKGKALRRSKPPGLATRNPEIVILGGLLLNFKLSGKQMDWKLFRPWQLCHAPLTAALCYLPACHWWQETDVECLYRAQSSDCRV